MKFRPQATVELHKDKVFQGLYYTRLLLLYLKFTTVVIYSCKGIQDLRNHTGTNFVAFFLHPQKI